MTLAEIKREYPLLKADLFSLAWQLLDEGDFGVIIVTMQMEIVSPADQSDDWEPPSTKAARQRKSAAFSLQWADAATEGFLTRLKALSRGDLTVLLTRYGPRPINWDHLPLAFKPVQEGVADWLGSEAGSPKLKWHYFQKPNRLKGTTVRVMATPFPPDADEGVHLHL